MHPFARPCTKSQNESGKRVFVIVARVVNEDHEFIFIALPMHQRGQWTADPAVLLDQIVFEVELST